MVNTKSLKLAKANIDCLIKSCEEALDGSWDCTGFGLELPKDAQEGFEAMLDQLEQVKQFLGVLMPRFIIRKLAKRRGWVVLDTTNNTTASGTCKTKAEALQALARREKEVANG